MEELESPSLYKEKVQFLLSVIENEEYGRSSLGKKVDFIIAANTILLGAMIVLFLPLKPIILFGLRMEIILSIIIFTSAFISIIFSAIVHAPLLLYKERIRVGLDLPPNSKNENNLFYFMQISKLDKSDYKKKIDELSKAGILDQLVYEVHNLSRILKKRYQKIQVAHTAFMVELFAFFIFLFTKFFNT